MKTAAFIIGLVIGMLASRVFHRCKAAVIQWASDLDERLNGPEI